MFKKGQKKSTGVAKREQRTAYTLLALPIIWWIIFFLVPLFMALFIPIPKSTTS